MKEILSVTIDGDTYRKYKELYDKTQHSKIAIHFGDSSKYRYEWELFTKDEAIIRMAKRYEFMLSKHNEQQQMQIANLKEKIELLQKRLEEKNENN